MCNRNPITKDHIATMKSSLLKRMENPNLTQEQLLILREQYEYVVNNVRERPGYYPDATESNRTEKS
ncbi:MAG: hypothetical protein HYY30_12655 [Chloroflexi bacterium]|nr:hypothetical protein [Chloroflexota bacterium]